MSSSASEPGKPAGSSEPARAESPARADQTPDRALLEKVLQQTLSDDWAASPDLAVLEAMRAVARRYQGQPFGLEPIAVELVHAVVCTQFPSQSEVVGTWRAVSAQVAQSLFEDPVACERLRSIWSRLSES